MIKPYKKTITFADIWAFRPEEPTTHTAVPLINAVAEALYSTNMNECRKIAKALDVDGRVLQTIVKFELGMSFNELLHQYRFKQVSEYVAQNPDVRLEEVAHRFGYASYGSLWRFMQRIGGVTPNGEKSNAGPELWLQWRKQREQ